MKKYAVLVFFVVVAVIVVYAAGLCFVASAEQMRIAAMESEGYAAQIGPQRIVCPQSAAGKEVIFPVVVWNTGSKVWEPESTTALGLFQQKSKDILFGREGHGNEPQWRFKPKTRMCSNGNGREFVVKFQAPDKPGIYLMRLQMVDERLDKNGQPMKGRWFGPVAKFFLTVSSAAGVSPSA